MNKHLKNKRFFVVYFNAIALLFLNNGTYADEIPNQTEKIIVAGVVFKNENNNLPADILETEKRVQIKNSTKGDLIEGYKIERNGKRSTYVHGEIIENKKGYISGYLYEKKGEKTFIYGHSSDAKETILKSNNDMDSNVKTYQVKGSESSMGEIIHDDDSNEYLLNKQ